MKEKIIEKLKKFLSERSQIKEECEVVYLLVELRKLLDKEREENSSNDYSMVRFYADWAVHTNKEYITPSMKKIMDNIEKSINPYPKNGDISFLSMPELRKELTQLLRGYELSNKFCEDDNDWRVFVTTMTQVIADQPIVNPTPNISEFKYIDFGKNGIMANINFRGSKSGRSITLGDV